MLPTSVKRLVVNPSALVKVRGWPCSQARIYIYARMAM
jgi:hypothetical protein